MSLWRKRNVKHNEQKHDNLSDPLDLLHQKNVRLGLYEIVYDLSIKSDDLSIKSEETMRKVQRLGQEIQPEENMTKEAIKLAIEWIESQPEETTESKYDVNSRYAVLKELEAALTQEQGEPVAYISNKRQRLNIELKPQTFVEIPTVTDWEMPLYTHPQQRTWVGLTDEEIGMAFRAVFPVGGVVFTNGATEFAQTIERKLKDKNT
jgi:hypothetical protein